MHGTYGAVLTILMEKENLNKEKYFADCSNILHIGGHEGQEAGLYKLLGKQFTFVEPMPEYAERMRKKGFNVIEKAVTCETGKRVIILCAGEASRWQNYKNTPKHLIEIEGERLLDRTTRLLNEKGINDIIVVTKEYDERYNTEYSRQVPVTIDYEKNADADKFLSSKSLWNTEGRTIVLYGDVYFTEEAINTIVDFEKREWTLFAREKASSYTGTQWGECFAQSFYPEHIEKHEQKLNEIANLKKQGKLKRCGGWEHYRAMTGQENLNKHTVTTNFVEIDDWTEDFDFPKDLEEWLKNRKIWLRKN